VLEEYSIHILWFLMSCAFGTWMYFQGAVKGTTAGVNAAVVFLVLNGKRGEAENFVEFINGLTGKNFKIDK
jgi:thiol:disulfide interchange protein